MAPEVLKDEPYGKACDLWSAGVVMFILLSSLPPFFNYDKFKLFKIVEKGQYSMKAPVW